jgi:hypothetical protein
MKKKRVTNDVFRFTIGKSGKPRKDRITCSNNETARNSARHEIESMGGEDVPRTAILVVAGPRKASFPQKANSACSFNNGILVKCRKKGNRNLPTFSSLLAW